MDILNSLPIRAKAICLVNLVTASRPNEMVRLRVRDFDLKNRSVHVYLNKQKRWHTKRLTLEVINAIEFYIREYHLKPDDYFVGRVLLLIQLTLKEQSYKAAYTLDDLYFSLTYSSFIIT